MVDSGRPVLLVSSDDSLYQRLREILPPPHYAVTMASDVERAGRLAIERPFDLLIVDYPTRCGEVAELVKSVRWSGSPNRATSIVAMTDPDNLDDAEATLDRGIGRILNRLAGPERMRQALLEILAPEQRLPVKALLRIQGEELGLTGMVMAQTQNLSSHGMLVRLDKAVRIGLRFAFSLDLPGHRNPLKGTAAAVRVAQDAEEQPTGFAARFVELEGDGRQQLEAFLAQEAKRSAKPGKA